MDQDTQETQPVDATTMDEDSSSESSWSDMDGRRESWAQWKEVAERKMEEWCDLYAKNLFDLQVRKWLIEERKRSQSKK